MGLFQKEKKFIKPSKKHKRVCTDFFLNFLGIPMDLKEAEYAENLKEMAEFAVELAGGVSANGYSLRLSQELLSR